MFEELSQRLDALEAQVLWLRAREDERRRAAGPQLPEDTESRTRLLEQWYLHYFDT